MLSVIRHLCLFRYLFAFFLLGYHRLCALCVCYYYSDFDEQHCVGTIAEWWEDTLLDTGCEC